MSDVPAFVADQIAAIPLDPSRPLIISDADEVLLRFIDGLERYLEGRGLMLDLTSFAIHGNVKDGATGAVVADDAVTGLLKGFYADETAAHGLEALPGASAVLSRMSARAQVVILTNVALAVKPQREANLAAHDLPFPVIANEGLKGPAVAALIARAGRPCFFLDDIPHNITSVRAHAPETVCVHVVTEPRLIPLIGTAPGADHRCGTWAEIESVLDDALTAAGC